ncbi:hypothetical protein NDU88_002976 [Pleurodeles waltl]|uniref:Uncharacterized protein n=1 Tax=Pleurodeles waltl TaxID=8319 RepID=A0AAV7M261_PLEWA|nr:hypothetical protein NDU88_002976 [Pleurodeles waltl]
MVFVWPVHVLHIGRFYQLKSARCGERQRLLLLVVLGAMVPWVPSAAKASHAEGEATNSRAPDGTNSHSS